MFAFLRLFGFFSGFILVRESYKALKQLTPGGYTHNLARMSKDQIRDLLDTAADDETRAVLQSYL